MKIIMKTGNHSGSSGSSMITKTSHRDNNHLYPVRLLLLGGKRKRDWLLY